MRTSESIKELAAAMVKVQKAMAPAKKDSINPHFKSKYADLSAVWDACRTPLNDNGIAVWQSVEGDVSCVAVVTRLVHISGEWAEFGPLTIPLAKGTAHDVGSGTSYGKRYALAAAVGVVAEDDDDGNQAVASKSSNGHKEAAPAPALAFGIDKEIIDTATALRGILGGKSTIESLIQDASAFDGKEGPVSFKDPSTVKSDKWKKSTLTKLKTRLEKNQVAEEETAGQELPF